LLEVFSATSFEGILDKGGRTKPWVVLVNENGNPSPFVMKLFHTAEIDKRSSVANEVVGSVLASQFDLAVPKPILIEIEESFRYTINDYEAIDALDVKDERIKFGCELLQGYNMFVSEAFKPYQVKKMIQIDTLFAFDNLIRNADRKAKVKPNLLVRGNSAVIIDHELGFEIDKDTINDFRNLNWDSRFYSTHLAYNYLKKSNRAIKIHYFDEFEEYLRRLNINCFDSHLRQLQNYGYGIAKFDIVKSYLEEVKQNSNKFVNMLRSFI